MLKNIFNNLNLNSRSLEFWKKFSRYLLVGVSIFTLLFSSQSVAFQEIQIANAQTTDTPSSLSGSCSGGNANFSWNHAVRNGEQAFNYTIRVNRAPFDVWSPDDGVSGDRTFQVPINNSFSTVLPDGDYGFSVQAGYQSDMTTTGAVDGPLFNCASSPAPTPPPATPAPTAEPTAAPTAEPTPVVTPTPVPGPVVTPPPSGGTSRLEGGNFMTGFNNTTQAGTWRDPVEAVPGDVIEFKVRAYNTGSAAAPGVQMWGSITGQVPQDPALQLVITGKINDPSAASSLTDTTTVNITNGVPVGMRYYPGHARINGVTEVYNCPNTCDIPDAGVLGGLTVGTIQPNDFVELSFKASLIAVGSTPTPTPTPGPATPTPAPQGGNTTNTNTNVGVNVNTNTNTNTNTANASASASAQGGSATTGPITINVPANTNTITREIIREIQARGGNVGVGTSAGTQVLSITQLPKTGLPILAWTALAFVPAGFRLRRFSSLKRDLENHPSFIHEDRQFKRA